MDALPQPHPVGLRFIGNAPAPADVVQVAQRHGRVALLVVGLGDIEVKLRHAVDREFEPFARTGFIPEFDVLGTAVLPLVFELPVLVQIPTAVAGIVLGVDAVEIERRLRAGFQLFGLVAVFAGRAPVVHARPRLIRTVGLAVLAELTVAGAAVLPQVVAGVGRHEGVVLVDTVVVGLALLLVGQQHLAVRRRTNGRAVILDGVARVDQLEAVGLAPVDHLLIGQARRFPALGIVAPEPDHLIVRGVGHLHVGSVGIEEGTGGVHQRFGLDGQRHALVHAPQPVGRPAHAFECRGGRVAQPDDEVKGLLHGGAGAHVDRGERRFDQRHAAVALEHLHVAESHQHLHFGLDDGFVAVGHVGDLVDVLVHEPRLADVGVVVGEIVVGITGAVILVVGQHARHDLLVHVSPCQAAKVFAAHDGFGRLVGHDRGVVPHQYGQSRGEDRGVGLGDRPLGVLGRAEDLVLIHARHFGLLDEPVLAGRKAGRQQQAEKRINGLFHKAAT